MGGGSRLRDDELSPTTIRRRIRGLPKTVYLSRDTIDLLLKACQNVREQDLIFNLASGARLSDLAHLARTNYFSLHSTFKKIAARAGIPNITPHDLKYSFMVYEICVIGNYDFSALQTLFSSTECW